MPCSSSAHPSPAVVVSAAAAQLLRRHQLVTPASSLPLPSVCFQLPSPPSSPVSASCYRLLLCSSSSILLPAWAMQFSVATLPVQRRRSTSSLCQLLLIVPNSLLPRRQSVTAARSASVSAVSTSGCHDQPCSLSLVSSTATVGSAVIVNVSSCLQQPCPFSATAPLVQLLFLAANSCKLRHPSLFQATSRLASCMHFLAGSFVYLFGCI